MKPWNNRLPCVEDEDDDSITMVDEEVAARLDLLKQKVKIRAILETRSNLHRTRVRYVLIFAGFVRR